MLMSLNSIINFNSGGNKTNILKKCCISVFVLIMMSSLFFTAYASEESAAPEILRGMNAVETASGIQSSKFISCADNFNSDNGWAAVIDVKFKKKNYSFSVSLCDSQMRLTKFSVSNGLLNILTNPAGNSSTSQMTSYDASYEQNVVYSYIVTVDKNETVSYYQRNIMSGNYVKIVDAQNGLQKSSDSSLCNGILMYLDGVELSFSVFSVDKTLTNGYFTQERLNFENSYEDFCADSSCEGLIEEGINGTLTMSNSVLQVSSDKNGYCGISKTVDAVSDWILEFEVALDKGYAYVGFNDGASRTTLTIAEDFAYASGYDDLDSLWQRNRSLKTEINTWYRYIIKKTDDFIDIYRRKSGATEYEKVFSNIKIQQSVSSPKLKIFADNALTGSSFRIKDVELKNKIDKSLYSTLSENNIVINQGKVSLDYSIGYKYDGYELSKDVVTYTGLYDKNQKLLSAKIHKMTLSTNEEKSFSYEIEINGEVEENQEMSVRQFIWTEDMRPRRDKIECLVNQRMEEDK